MKSSALLSDDFLQCKHRLGLVMPVQNLLMIAFAKLSEP